MRQIGSIQVLRAVAALMVVVAHAQDDALNEALKAGIAFARSHALPWVSGVDLFFVISGFIMVHASRDLFATDGASRMFLGRRLIRIVPLYWLVTGFWLAVALALARHGKGIVPSPAEIVTSLGFVPFARPGDGAPRPIVSLGWTLNYEMLFYVVFALFVRFRRDTAVIGVAATLAIAVTLGAILRPDLVALAYWSDPIVLEFVLGMGLAMIWSAGLRLSRGAAVVVATAGVGVLALDLDGMARVAGFGVDPNGFGRLAACGLPMALVLGAIVLARPRGTPGHVLPRAILIGDASYALYLTHPLVVVLARKAYLALGLAAPLGFWPLVIADLLLATGFAVAVHLTIEKPLIRALHVRLLGAKRGNTRREPKHPVLGPRGEPAMEAEIRAG